MYITIDVMSVSTPHSLPTQNKHDMTLFYTRTHQKLSIGEYNQKSDNILICN